MNELLSSFLSNDSAFGRLMTRCGVIIGANLLFCLFCLPVVTIGASSAALHFVMLKALRGDGQVNPFKCFWKGFRSNFIQATIAWLLIAALAVFLFLDLRICLRAGMPLELLKYPLYGMLLAEAILAICLFPVMAAFEGTLPRLLQNTFYVAVKRVYIVPVLLFFNFFPLYLTYTDPQMLPLYAFLWVFFGYGAIAMLNSRLLLPAMKPWLPMVDEYGDFVLTRDGEKQAYTGEDRTKDPHNYEETSAAMSESRPADENSAAKKTLEEMEKLGM